MFSRIELLLTQEEINKLNNLSILIVGIGGVGGYALEMLVRSAINNITIIDSDVIELSNLNRQIISLQSNIGNSKVEVAKQRALDINPNLNITTICNFLTKDNINELLNAKYDYIIDACDTITTKVELIKYATLNDIKIVSCMGTGNKLDPTRLELIKIKQTSYDPIAKIVRKLLKENNINNNIMTVCSTEIPRKTENRRPASLALVPSTAGILCASYVINDTLKKDML